MLTHYNDTYIHLLIFREYNVIRYAIKNDYDVNNSSHKVVTLNLDKARFEAI